MQFLARVQTMELEGLSWGYLIVTTLQSCIRHAGNTSFQLKMYVRQVLFTIVCHTHACKGTRTCLQFESV